MNADLLFYIFGGVTCLGALGVVELFAVEVEIEVVVGGEEVEAGDGVIAPAHPGFSRRAVPVRHPKGVQFGPDLSAPGLP